MIRKSGDRFSEKIMPKVAERQSSTAGEQMAPTAGSGLMDQAYDARDRVSCAIVHRCQAVGAQLLCGGNLEHQAGGGGVRQQAALAVGDARFRGRGAAADMQGAALAAN